MRRSLRDRLARRRASTIAALVVVLAIGLAPGTYFLEGLELRTQDMRFARRGPRDTSAGIVLVTLDDLTVVDWADLPMALWGARYAALVRQARASGAAWIGFDIIPASNVEESLQIMVARAFERVRRKSRAVSPVIDEVLDDLLAAPEMRPDSLFREAIREMNGRALLADRISPGLLMDDLRGLMDREYIGFVDFPFQKDDAVRTGALFLRSGRHIQPGFAALLAARAHGLDPRRRSDLESLTRGRAHTVWNLGTFWINYTGRPFHTIPAHRLAAGRLTDTDRRALLGALVLVGSTQRGSGDWRRTPNANVASLDTRQQYEAGVTIHAQALATLLDGRALGRGTPVQEGLVAAGLALLLAPPLLTFPLWWRLGLSAAVMGSWWWVACRVFATSDYLLPVAVPLLGTGSLFLICEIAQSMEEAALARQQVKRIFGRYVSPEICNYLLESPRNLELGGLEGEASVLFFDVRGSTSFAEKRSPIEVMDELNVLFREVVPVLDRHGGLLYRFRGDGFLAVFGAPLPLGNHARAATEAAAEIVRAVRRLNALRNSVGGPPWRVGCGIHSGALVFGNLGVADRSEFTVIGDTVNLAARIEELNKALDSEVLVSQATYERLSGLLTAHGPFPCKVVGRQDPVYVYVVPVA